MAPFRALPTYRNRRIARVAVLGAGSVGRSWTALFLAHGLSVVVSDPAPGVPDQVASFIRAAWPAIRQLVASAPSAPPLDCLTFAQSPADAVRGADLVQENGPEDEDFKVALIAAADAQAEADVPILSSTGGIVPSRLQAGCRHPGRVLVVHPFNPPHLIPLVEIVGGTKTDSDVIEWARAFFLALGKRPIVLHRELPGHLANRFQAALMREIFHCLNEDLASPQDIDDAIRYGLGPRWALMGGLMTFHLAGGSGGAAHTLALAADAYEQWWASLGTVHLTPDVRERIVAAANEISGDRPIEDLIEWRDRSLVALSATLESLNG